MKTEFRTWNNKRQKIYYDCDNCIWILFTGASCETIQHHGYDYRDDIQLIKRLRE